MSQKEFLEDFKAWAVKLGCDNESMPSEDALKTIFKSHQSELFKNLMRRVLPRGDVISIRENILINKIEKVKDLEVVTQTCGKSFLPREMQKYHNMYDLNIKKSKILKRLEEHRKEYETLATSIKAKNIKSVNFEHKERLLKAKNAILEFKSESLDKQLTEENENKKNILATMPVKLSTHTNNDNVAMEAVQNTLNILENFYNNTEIGNISAESKEELWKEIRTNFSDIPNFSIFNVVMRLKDEQLQNIISLNGQTLNKTLGFSYKPSLSKEPFSSYEMKIAKTKASFLGLVAKYIKVRIERDHLEEVFSKAYIEFVDELQKKLNLYNSENDENVEEIISNYLVQLNSIIFSNSENEYIAQQIERFKIDIENTNKQIENHEVLLGLIKQVYFDINASVNRLQVEMVQLNQIKDKIVYSKNILRQLLNEMKPKSTTWSMDVRNNFLQPQIKVNDITLSADSFEMGTENVLCSTKLDLDITMSSLNSSALLRSFCSMDATVMSGGTHNNLPTYLLELNTFAESPIENFSCISNPCAFYLSPNPIIIESQELSPALQMTPGALLTPYGALQEIITRTKQAVLISKHSTDLKYSLDLTHIDTNLFKEKQKLQKEIIAQLFDKIKETGINTEHILNRCSKLYNFLLENPLRHYIPHHKTFNNQTYSDYESEYNFYYRLSTGDTSTK
ncbi:augmin complex subunit dgt5-like [Teleopsis dalmanni]|uniref:augmin complex subunit dgt5-like n=1 Tax=Teleopsis dalmanni TaxID=139649 RepID=UPI0018CFBC33|nr:augmin complex subunit dgt5-like [Teleopsis dalmanni]